MGIYGTSHNDSTKVKLINKGSITLVSPFFANAVLCAVKIQKMKVICINNKPINDPDGIPAWCNDLVEGEIYTAEYVAKSRWGNNCYFITEVQDLRRVERFRRIDDNFVEELLSRIIEEIEAEEFVSA